jgi:hypothetical protein
MALGTITGLLTRIPTPLDQPKIAKLVLTCTAGTGAQAGAYPATVLNPLAVDSNGNSFDIRGMKLYSVKAYPGTTAPTDATDATITDEFGIDILGGKGSDLIDATTKTFIPSGPGAFAQPALITGNITLNITSNSVESAVTTIICEFIG